MPVRLLLVLLTLTGIVPIRVCTCAAATQPKPSAVEKSPCCCRSESKCAGEAAPLPVGPTHASEAPCGDHHPVPHPHDRDCPAANPLAAVEPAVPAGYPILLDSLDLLPPPWSEPFVWGLVVSPAPPSPSRPHVGHVPLYLALRTIRI